MCMTAFVSPCSMVAGHMPWLNQKNTASILFGGVRGIGKAFLSNFLTANRKGVMLCLGCLLLKWMSARCLKLMVIDLCLYSRPRFLLMMGCQDKTCLFLLAGIEYAEEVITRRPHDPSLCCALVTEAVQWQCSLGTAANYVVGISLPPFQNVYWVALQNCICSLRNFRSIPFYLKILFFYNPLMKHLWKLAFSCASVELA